MYKSTKLLKFILFSIVINLCLLLSGCFATGYQFQQYSYNAPNMSNIYVYRTSGFVGILVSEPVFLDNVKVGSVKDGGYIVLHVMPGTHTLKIYNDKEIIISSTYITQLIKAKPNTNYYYKISAGFDFNKTNYIAGSKSTNYAPIATPGFSRSLLMVPETQALNELSSLRQSN